MYENQASHIKYLETWFEGMRDAGFNPDAELNWCYSFRDADVEKLKTIARKLEPLRYTVTDLFEDDDPDDEESAGEFILSIEKVEKHTPETLARRNAEFAQLASEYSFGAGKV